MNKKLVIKRNQRLKISVHLEEDCKQMQITACTMLYSYEENGDSVLQFEHTDARVLRRINRLVNKMKKQIFKTLESC